MYEKKTNQISVKLGDNTLKNLDILAEKNKRTRADLVRIIIENEIEKNINIIEEIKSEEVKNKQVISNSKNIVINNN